MKKNNFGGAILKFSALLLLGLLSACGGEQLADAPPQKWKEVDVRIEARPSPPRMGMNEFLVILTGEKGRPVYNVIVSMRTSDADEWKQAIQDGQVGVYRRAAEVASGERSVLQVQLKRDGVENVLRFPLKF